MAELKHPDPDELVVTVLGGSGQGESVVVHVGDGHWIVIDSYTTNNQSLPFLYLSSIKADFNNVELVICSHWHSDHIKGLYQILSASPNAKFYVPSVTQSDYYPQFFAGTYADNEFTEEGANKVIDEFNQCMKHAIENGIIDYLVRDKTLLKRKVHGQCLEISAISPSQDMMTRFNQMFASNQGGKYKEYGIVPNMCCSAIIISINNELNLLLGADLESNRDKGDKNFDDCPSQCANRSILGWCNTFQESQNHHYVGKYRYVKISHHSSDTGYCPRLWSEKVTDDVVGTTTVFNANLLPQPEMAELYSKKCKEYYISSTPIKLIVNKEPNDLNLLKDAGIIRSVFVSAGKMGIISSKFSITSKQYLGTELDGTAFQYYNLSGF